MERADGTQARLKHSCTVHDSLYGCHRGKGGWDSGEIETVQAASDVAGDIAWKGRMGLRRD